jgi:hypothetical protein
MSRVLMPFQGVAVCVDPIPRALPWAAFCQGVALTDILLPRCHVLTGFDATSQSATRRLTNVFFRRGTRHFGHRAAASRTRVVDMEDCG